VFILQVSERLCKGNQIVIMAIKEIIGLLVEQSWIKMEKVFKIMKMDALMMGCKMTL